jgi:hypothetical protein
MVLHVHWCPSHFQACGINGSNNTQLAQYDILLMKTSHLVQNTTKGWQHLVPLFCFQYTTVGASVQPTTEIYANANAKPCV